MKLSICLPLFFFFFKKIHSLIQQVGYQTMTLWLLPVSVNIVLLEHRYTYSPIHLHIDYACFCATAADLSSYDSASKSRKYLLFDQL